MSRAFTDKEKSIIQRKMLDEVRKCAGTLGMARTSVEQLARAAGISKGAFYRFYPSKESLFLLVLEEWHASLYCAALDALEEGRGLPDCQRMALAINRASQLLERNRMQDFFEFDVPVLLSRLPDDELRQHYHSDEHHIRRLMEEAGIQLTVELSVAAAAIRGLLTLSHHKELGHNHDQALQVIIEGTCARLTEPSLDCAHRRIQ